MGLYLIFSLTFGASIAGASIFMAFLFRRVVPTNMVHIVQSKKSTVSYGKDQAAGNVYYAWPAFLPVIGVSVIKLPESVFQIELKAYDAYDANRVPFVVDVVGFFRIERSGTAAHRIGSFDELTDQLQAVLQGAVRRVLARNPLEDTMEARGSLGQTFTEEVNAQLTEELGVKAVRTIEFMDIRDANNSEVIANIMAKDMSRIDRESRMAVASNGRAAETAEIEAAREVELRKQEAQQAVGQRTAEKDKAVGIAKEMARQEIQVQAKITAEKEKDVKAVQEQRDAEIAKNVAVTNASAEAEATIKRSEGELAKTRNDAQGVQATGQAEAEAARLLQLAPISAQIELAKEIGSNAGYQTYLVEIRRVEATMEVGKAMAAAIGDAELKVIATDGNVQNGMNKLADLLTPKGGTALGGMLSALAQTEEGKAIIGKLGGVSE